MARKLHASTLMKRRWVTPVGLGVVLLAFAGFCGVPYFTSMNKMKAEIVSLKQKIANSGRQSQELKDLTKQNQVLKMEVKKFDRLVPPTQDKGNFYEAVSDAQKDAKLDPKDVNAAMLASNRLGRCLALPMELHIKGDADKFYVFLEKLEGLERRSAVSKLNIETDQKMQGKIMADMTLSIFTMAPTKDLPK